MSGGGEPAAIQVSEKRFNAENYIFDQKCAGKAVVISISNFDTVRRGFRHRSCSETDKQNVKKILDKLKLTLVQELDDESNNGINRMYEKDDILKELQQTAKDINSKPHENEAFCCIIMSYGGHGFFYDSKAKKVYMSQVMKIFDSQHCPGLILKPKIFIMQVCDPEDEIPRVPYQFGDQAPKSEVQKQETLPSQADFIVYCSVLSAIYHQQECMPIKDREPLDDMGDKKVGSAFIEYLRDVICCKSGHVNFRDIVFEVNGKMIEEVNRYLTKWYNAIDEKYKIGYKDIKMPCITSTLTKNLIFKLEEAIE